jgi:hypothetical protein
MRKVLIGMAAAVAAGVAITAGAAPYEDQRIRQQRVQEARLKAESPAVAMGGMHQHMTQMQEMNRQLQEARSVDQMSPEQMRDWITQHVRLMDQMHRQMTGAQPPAMGGPGMPPRPGQ